MTVENGGVNMREHFAFRAAGQAVGAVLVGARTEFVSVEDGAVVDWNEAHPIGVRSTASLLAEILVILTGVGAQRRYSFGVPPGDAVWLMPRADETIAMQDVEHADAVSTLIANPESSGLEFVWRYAAELVCQPDIWQAIETVAEHLIEEPIEGQEIALLCSAAAASGGDDLGSSDPHTTVTRSNPAPSGLAPAHKVLRAAASRAALRRQRAASRRRQR